MGESLFSSPGCYSCYHSYGIVPRIIPALTVRTVNDRIATGHLLLYYLRGGHCAQSGPPFCVIPDQRCCAECASSYVTELTTLTD